MKKTSKLLSLLLVLSLLLGLTVGCAPATEPKEAEKKTEAAKDDAKDKGSEAAPADDKADAETAEAEKAKEEKTEEKKDEGAEKKNKVALILEGAISDMSWNATAHEGLKKIEALGAETKYVENVPASSAQDSIRTFADEGYNVIFLSSNSYQDALAGVAKEFPQVQFFAINSTLTEDNICSFAIQDAEQGFLMGALAALLTKSNTVGFIGGLPINPIINGGKGFAQGVAYVNKDIKILSENTGNFDDVGAAKELGKAMISQGADVLAPMANQASLGVMEAAEEAGAKGIASGLNMESIAPKACVVAILKDTSIAYEAAYKAYIDKKIPNDILPMGAAQGVVSIGEYYVDVPDEVKSELQNIYDKLKAGEITIKLD